MAVTSSSCSDIGAFLNILEDTIVANGWVSHKDNKISPYTRSYSLTEETEQIIMPRFFEGKGLNNKDSIHVSMAIKYNKKAPFYTIMMRANRSYDPTKAWDAQYSSHTYFCCVPMWAQQMRYWIFVNGRRVIFFTKVAHRYTSGYFGFILPSGTDLEYPYPLYVGGTTFWDTLGYDSSNTSGTRSFWDTTTYTNQAERGNGFIYDPGYQGIIAIGTESRASDSLQSCIMYPYRQAIFQGKAYDGQYVLMPIHLTQNKDFWQVLGTLDGCFYVTGFENSPENLLRIGTDTYICFPAMIQAEWNNYVAIKWE